MAIPEPLAALATLAGLAADFVSSRKAGEASDHDAYIDWLRRCEHQQVVDYLEGNREMSEAIKLLWKRQHSDVITLLKEMEARFVSVVSNMAVIGRMAAATTRKPLISDQARSVLRQMNGAKASYITEYRTTSAGRFYGIDGDWVRKIEIDDPRFIGDDISQLCKLNLLDLRGEDWNDRKFYITRLGAEVGGPESDPVDD